MLPGIKNSLNSKELSVFQTIYEQGPISRVRLSEIFGLTRAALTINTKKLIKLELIEELGEGQTNTQGRREILLSVKASAGFVVSVHISLQYITLGIVDLKGKILDKEKQLFPGTLPPNKILDLLAELIESRIEKCNLCRERIFGISIGLPGIVDIHKGIVLETLFEGWANFPLRDYLEKKLKYKVCIENDVKTLTLGEFTFGTAKHLRDFICLWVEDGIGLGIMINGDLLRGVAYSAGEIGYSRILFDQPDKDSLLFNGHQNFWGDILSFTNIKASIQRGLKKGWQSSLTEDATLDEYCQSIKLKDPLAIHISNLFSKMLAKVAFNLIYTFNPEELLLSGPLFNQIPDLANDIYSYIKKEVSPFRIPLETVKLRTSNLGEDGITIGGSVLVMRDFFSC